MICQKCHKNHASIRYAEVINGRVADLMICTSCYTEMQADVTSGFEIAGSAPSPRARPVREQQAQALIHPRSCKTCGTELSEILETAQVGCTDCYEHFLSSIESALRECQAGSRHRGKSLHVDSTRERMRSELQTKRGLLRSALKTENYEEAAVLRDTIRELETALGAPSQDGD